MSDFPRVCGFAQHEMALLREGDGNPELGRVRLAQKALDALQASGTGTELAIAEASYELGDAFDRLGDHAAASIWIERALGSRAFRESSTWVHSCSSLALGYLWRGDFARAEPIARESLAHARAGKKRDQDALVSALKTHAEVLIGLGAHAEALVELDEAKRLFDESAWMNEHRPGYAITTQLLVGRALDGLGRSAEALGVFDAVEKIAGSGPWASSSTQFDVLVASATARRRAGREDDARARAQQAYAWMAGSIANRRKFGLAEEDIAKAERERARFAEAWGLAQ